MRKVLLFCSAIFLIIALSGCSEMKAKKEIKKGDELFAAEKYDEAIAHYTLAKEALPETCIPHIKKGDAYMKMEKWQDAKSEFLKVVAICPESLSVFERFADSLVPVVLNGLKVEKNKVMRDSTGNVKGIVLSDMGITDANCIEGIDRRYY